MLGRHVVEDDRVAMLPNPPCSEHDQCRCAFAQSTGCRPGSPRPPLHEVVFHNR